MTYLLCSHPDRYRCCGFLHVSKSMQFYMTVFHFDPFRHSFQILSCPQFCCSYCLIFCLPGLTYYDTNGSITMPPKIRAFHPFLQKLTDLLFFSQDLIAIAKLYKHLCTSCAAQEMLAQRSTSGKIQLHLRPLKHIRN